jgi:hypothetical protein
MFAEAEVVAGIERPVVAQYWQERYTFCCFFNYIEKKRGKSVRF